MRHTQQPGKSHVICIRQLLDGVNVVGVLVCAGNVETSGQLSAILGSANLDTRIWSQAYPKAPVRRPQKVNLGKLVG